MLHGYPRIETHPKLRSVEKDRSVLLQCDAKGDPKPTVIWLKDGLPVDTSDPRIQVMESGYLQILNSQESDEATYECVAENEHGVAYSYRAMIYIKVRRIAPKFTRAPEDTRVMPGSDVNLTCVAVGSPMPYVKWRQAAQDLTGDDNIPIGKNILQLTNVVESKNYTCEASSDLGNIEHHVQVIVDALPHPPTGLRGSEVTASTIRLTWERDTKSLDKPHSYTVYYRALTSGAGGRMQEVSGITRPVVTIGQLRAFTRYSFQVVAFNKMGRSRHSDAIEVVTGELGQYVPTPHHHHHPAQQHHCHHHITLPVSPTPHPH
ncbi:receptor-type tyrosine-protein phosphatase F [Aplysia californica]|uniref:Receptor-type tyrosine-protein phosphatase F n=1 Tax=Aplysia californica TaxID=6500 RepID=A0ABM1AAY9_APLCA|nr:receptor-type tyrosine-protein phosphatase F [Aplysia californica]